MSLEERLNHQIHQLRLTSDLLVSQEQPLNYGAYIEMLTTISIETADFAIFLNTQWVAVYRETQRRQQAARLE